MFQRRSIRTQLVVLFVVVATLPTSIFGAIAYRSQRSLILANATNTVAMAARARRATLLHRVIRNHARNAQFVSMVALACREDGDRAACLRRLLAAFVQTEDATAAVLTAPGLPRIEVGTPRGPMNVTLAPSQLAAFRRGGAVPASYVIVAANDGGRVVVERKFELLQEIFDDRFGLGASGETFLADAEGYFVSAARYHAESGHSHPIDARPMLRCLAGESATMIAGDYRPVEVVHAFQYLPELGGGCIMAHVDYAEAMQPVVALRNRALGVAAGFGAFALFVAWVLGWLLSKPLRALVDYAGTIAAGHFDKPPTSVRGSREITTLARALRSMAKSLKANLLLEQERVARIEAERGERRMRLLADTSAALSASLEQERALGQVASFATEALHASCFIHVRDEDGAMRVVGSPQHPSESPELERAVEGHASGVPLTFGKPFVCIPLSSPRLELGLLVFAREGDDARDFVESELELMREFGRRIVMALENERLYREVRDAVALRDSFISIASHELRTPLTALQLRLRRLRGGRAEQPETLGRALDSVDRQVARLDELIESLLDVSRISSGRMNLELSDVDMASVVREACARFRDALAQAGCPLTLQASANVVGRWDALRLDQIVSNLLSNAIKYGPGAPVEVRVEGDEHEGRLIVKDHGIGVPQEARTRIFERFGRAVRERRYSGLGLGLWIVREIVNALHGSIDLESEVGRGSTFTVHLPRTPDGRTIDE